MQTNLLYAIKVSALAIVLSMGMSYAFAWTAPTATPPGGNVSAPINTGSASAAQTILGKLTVSATTTALDLVAQRDLFAGTVNATGINVGMNSITFSDGTKMIPVNSTEDAYFPSFLSTGATDTCDGDTVVKYECSPDRAIICNDVSNNNGSTEYSRTVSCSVSKTFVNSPGPKTVFFFKGNVDGSLDMNLTGISYTEYNECCHGNLANTHGFSVGGINAGPLTLVKVIGRNSATITQQPTAANGYTAKVHIADGDYSEGNYQFYLTR